MSRNISDLKYPTGILGVVVGCVIATVLSYQSGYRDGRHQSSVARAATAAATAAAPASIHAAVRPRTATHPDGPYVGTITDIHDGDTMTLVDQLGFGVTFTFHCRVKGINAPELSTPEGKDALAYAKTRVHAGDQVTNYSYGPDKYGGRDDCSVTEPGGGDFGEDMVASGHAKVYNP